MTYDYSPTLSNCTSLKKYSLFLRRSKEFFKKYYAYKKSDKMYSNKTCMTVQ